MFSLGRVIRPGYAVMTAWLTIFWKEASAAGIIAALVAFAALAPVTLVTWQTRVIALLVAGWVGSTTWAYNGGISNGRALEQASQARALAAETTNGEQARTDAERDVAADPAGVSDDPWNRDNGKR